MDLVGIGTFLVLIGAFMAFVVMNKATAMPDTEENLPRRVQLANQFNGWSMVAFAGIFISFIGLLFT